MIKFNVSSDKAVNLPLLIGGITACVAPPLSKFLASQPIEANDWLIFFGCLAGLFTGNVERKPRIIRALEVEAKLAEKLAGKAND